MPHLGPIKRKDLVHYLRQMGFLPIPKSHSFAECVAVM